MERVLIVARTHMKEGVCIGGLTRSTNRSIRLLTEDGLHQPQDTRFDVGQVWDLEFLPMLTPTPPHVEDVYVTHQQYVAQLSKLSALLLERVQPWRGGPEQLFEQKLVLGRASSYICRANGLPACSTGYWLPNKELTLTYEHDKAYYRIAYSLNENGIRRTRTLFIRYVGFARPVFKIPAQTLMRVSLSRWWVGNDTDEERCYLQLSGWFM